MQTAAAAGQRLFSFGAVFPWKAVTFRPFPHRMGRRDARMLLVQKYGGTSLEGRDRILAAAHRVAALARQGHNLIVVVSAQGDTTDWLLSKAHEINSQPSPRELDACLAVGEQLSAALLAMALEGLGVEAVSFTGSQAGIHTDSQHGNAWIKFIDPRPIRQALLQGKVVIVAGFQGIDSLGNITTLGRGGSDTTAVALAAWLHGDKCQIFTDVDGIYDRDPRRFPDTVRFSRIGYGEMLSLIAGGAQVLHERCVLLAREAGIPIEVRSAFTEGPGTLVSQ